jgi:hypothetical protein
MDMYIEEDRDIAVYTLNLDRRAKETILAYAEDIVKPDNCYYDSHEFRDNCSTRIRDILDMGTDGQFKAAFSTVPGRYSVRQHIHRYIWFRPASEWFLGFLMGQNHDAQISPWDEMFLPVEIARNIVDFSYTDELGIQRKLVDSVQIINSSKERQPILNEPLVTWPFFLVAGLIVAALLFSIKALAANHPLAYRLLWALSQSLLGLLLGAAGFVLVFGFSMNNDYFQQNLNLLFVNPLLFVIVPLGILSAINIRLPVSPERVLRLIWTYVFLAGLLTVLLRALPFYYQQNQSVQGLVLPIAFAMSYIPEKAYKLKSLTRRIRLFRNFSF